MKDLRDTLAPLCTLADYERAREENLKDNLWACVCGSRSFKLYQDKHNVKAICSNCSAYDILYWNGTDTVSADSSLGYMRNLITNTWVHPVAELKVVPK